MNFQSKLTPFEYWVQRTLPQVYDDSLSFSELLNKVVAYLNDVIESQNITNENFVELDRLFRELQTYVQNYFDNLDLREEINEKLDAMVLDGTMDRIINHAIFEELNAELDGKAQYLHVNNVFEKNVDFNSKYFRIPTVEITNNGVVVAAADARYNGSSDNDVTDVVIARSFDYGRTWSEKKIVGKNNQVVPQSRKTNPMLLVDRNTNRVFLFYLVFDMALGWSQTTSDDQIVWDFVYKYSDNDGDTWSEELSIKHLFDLDPTVSFALGGCGKGITMKDGTLVLPIQIKNKDNDPWQFQSALIYSINNGLTWRWNGGKVSHRTSECSVIEHEDGRLLLNARGNIQARRVFETSNLGGSWAFHPSDKTLLEPGACQGSFDKIEIFGDKKYGLFLNPNSQSGRKNMQLKATQDFINYTVVHTLHKGTTDGYSCLTNYNGKLIAVIERHGDIEFHDLSGIQLNLGNEEKHEFKGYQKGTLDANGILRVTPDAKYVYVDVNASSSNTLKGIERAFPNQEIYITNFSQSYPLYFECSTDGIPFNNEVLPVDGIYKLKTTSGFLNTHSVNNEIKNNEWLHISINAKFAEFINIKNFATPGRGVKFLNLSSSRTLVDESEQYIHENVSAGSVTITLPPLSVLPNYHEITIRKKDSSENQVNVRPALETSDVMDSDNLKTYAIRGDDVTKVFKKIDSKWYIF